MADELVSTTSGEAQARYCTPTNAGNQLFAALVAEEAGIEFTKILVGSGEPDSSADPAELTGLVEFVTYGTMTTPIQDGDKVNFTVEYRNDLNNGLETGFWLREFGVWARKKGETSGDVMVFYGCLGDYPQYVEAYDGTHVDSRRFPLSITVGNVTSASASFSTDAFVTSTEMSEYVTSKTGDLGGKTITTLLTELEDAAKDYTDTAVNLTQATAATTLSETDLVGVQAASSDAPSSMTAKQFASCIVNLHYQGSSPDVIAEHNHHPRYKVLTDSYSLSEIFSMIAARDYSDIWAGDLVSFTLPAISATDWSAGTTRIYLGEIESHYKYGDTPVTKGHVLAFPETQFGTAYMNSTNITTGGYRGSYMYATVMPAVNTALASAFGSSHLLTSREITTIAVNTSASSKGVPTATGATYWNNTSWHDCKARQMSELEVYGSSEFSSSGEDGRGGLPHQIALFAADPRTIITRSRYWLSSVAYSADFCNVYGHGSVSDNVASDVYGVRPRFLIG